MTDERDASDAGERLRGHEFHDSRGDVGADATFAFDAFVDSL